MADKDKKLEFMRRAIQLSHDHSLVTCDGAPYAAVVVKDGEVVGR